MINDWVVATGIAAQQRRDMWEWDLRRRCPWLYDEEEVPAGDPSGTMTNETQTQVTTEPAAGSAPVVGLSESTERD